MAQKMNPKYFTLLFSVIIFILTAVGLAFLYYKTLVLPFWFAFVYIVAWALVFASAADFFVGNGKLSGKKFLLLTFGVMIISTTVTHSVWTIVTPRWSFSVSTDKPTYRLGENVQITVSLENIGFITHSFKSSLSDPVVVSIETYGLGPQVWYSPYHFNRTEFTIPSHESLERTFIWNQTNIHFPEEENEPDTYVVWAFIPKGEFLDPHVAGTLFCAYTKINITST